MTRPIARIAVAGDGIAAWLAAAALARQVPGAIVTQVPAGGGPAVGDLAVSLPPDRSALRRLGLDDATLFASGHAVFRLGVMLERWRGDGTVTTIGWGGMAEDESVGAIDQLWSRAARAGATPPFADLSPAAALIRANRSALPRDDPRHPFAELAVGLALTSAAMLRLAREAAARAGVRPAPSLAGVDVAGDRIAAIMLTGGERLTADLYVDATGSAARLLSALPGGGVREDWSGWLVADRVATRTAPADPALPPADRMIAEPAGWRLSSPLSNETLDLRCYQARRSRDPAGSRPVTMAQGRRRTAWIGNCVAVGDAAIDVEPLFSPHVTLLLRTLDRLVALLPDASCHPVEIEQFNREWRQEADHLRDLLVIAHAVARRREPYWRVAAPLPPSVEHLLTLWRERGYWPEREREFWGREQWLQLLLGVAELPAHTDPLADRHTPAAFSRWSEARLRSIADAVAGAPRHADMIAQLHRHGRG